MGLHNKTGGPVKKNGGSRTRNVFIRSEGRALHGLFKVPTPPFGVVVLLGESASSTDLARGLGEAGIASLAVDLFAPEEAGEEIRDPMIQNIDGLCSRLFDVTQWLCGRPETRALPLAYLARGLCGSAAVIEAARQPALVKGIVLRDAILASAGPWLPRLRIPVLRAGRDYNPVALAEWFAQLSRETPETREPGERAAPAGTEHKAPLLRTRCKRTARNPYRPAREPGRLGFTH